MPKYTTQYVECLRQAYIEVGGCPECCLTGSMHEEGPFSDCGCGTSEDYARRPVQKLELIERCGVTVDHGVVYLQGTKLEQVIFN